MNKEMLGEKIGLVYLDHYTYGLHPQELGYGVKAYSDEKNKKYYENILEKVINSVNFLTVSKKGEVRIFYILKKKAIISLVNTNGLDASKRKGLYSHNIVIDLQDYTNLGIHPDIFETYFIRDANLRGKLERLSVTPTPEQGLSRPVEIPAGTLKSILSSLLKDQGVKLICKNRDSSTISKILYFLLELLPPTERLVPYITAFPEKNQSNYKLIIIQEEEYVLPSKDWVTFDIDEIKNFSPNNAIDVAVNYMIDSYFKNGHNSLNECHKLWHEIRQKNPDIESCARIFSYRVNNREKGIQSLLEETMKAPEGRDIVEKCDFIIDNITEIPSSERFEKFLSLSKLKLSASKENIDGKLKNIMDKASSNFSKKEQLEMIISLGKEFPKYKTKINRYISDLEKDPNIKLDEYIKKYPDIINELDEGKKLKYIDILPTDKKIEQYYDYFNRIPIDELMELLHKDSESFSIYKSINNLYEYVKEPKYHNNKADEKVKSIIKKFVDTLDKTFEKKVFSRTILKKDIPIHTIERLLSSKALIILLYCLKYYKLGDYIKKLERISKEYIGIIFSLNDKDIQDIILIA